MAALPDPVYIGLPERFRSWRNGQDRAVLQALDSPKRFVVQNAPCGFGKSVVYLAEALLSGARTAILTASKGLQSQLLTDFAECGLFDIRGQNNYACKELMLGGAYRGEGLTPGETCDLAPCHFGARCRLRNGGCYYFDAVKGATQAQLVISNYPYWIAQHRYADGLGKFDLLILDEADEAPDELAAALQIELFDQDLRNTLGTHMPESEDVEVWIKWAEWEVLKAERKVNQLDAELKFAREEGKIRKGLLYEVHNVKDLVRRLKVVAGMKGHWVIERDKKSAKAAPVWPADYAESLLFLNIPKVVFVSATIQRKTLQFLGLKPEEFDFFEYPSTFPVVRRPVIHVPSGVRLRHDWSVTEQKMWTNRIDQIVEQRGDRKGIIHTTSYERRDILLSHSRNTDVMLVNDGKNTQKVVAQFKEADPPVVLVSPSLTSGWDLPYEACEYAIIAKIPFPDTRSRIVKARTEEDPDYGPYLAMRTIVQASGRGMRSADDQCEILIVDDMWKWFWWKYRAFAPAWFAQAVRRVLTVPKPLTKLNLNKEKCNG